MLSSVLAALAPSGAWLIASRLVQGVGGAMILPTTLSLINANFRGRERAIAFAVWGSTIGGMTAVGPLLGGWLTTSFSWRWAFGINVPLGIIIIVGVLLTVAESRDAGDARRIDWVGAILSIVTSATPRVRPHRGPDLRLVDDEDRPEARRLDVAVRPLPRPCRLRDRHRRRHRLRSLGPRTDSRRGGARCSHSTSSRIPSFRNGNIAAMIVSLGEFGIILSLPIWLQNVSATAHCRPVSSCSRSRSARSSPAASRARSATGSVRSPSSASGIAAEIVGVAGLGFVIGPSTTRGAP